MKLSQIINKIGREVHNPFQLDLRSLALMRIAVGVAIIADLITRAKNLTAHYTDSGIMPRSYLVNNMGDYDFSFHLINGSTAFQAFLFICIGLVAFLFIIGYRTKVMNVALWFLMVSLQVRNSWVLDNGDLLLQLCLFWGAFLPLGIRWSIDAKRNPQYKDIPNKFSSVSSLAFVLQIFIIYIFTAILKSDASWRTDFTALYYAFNLEQFTLPTGYWLLQFYDLTRVLSLGAILTEFYAPLLIVFPFFNRYTRLIGILALGGLHTGIAATMHVGIFPLADIATLAALLPTDFWETLTEVVRWNWRFLEKTKSQISRLAVRFDQLVTKLVAANPKPVKLYEAAVIPSILCIVFSFYVVLVNLASLPASNVHIPESLTTIGSVVRLTQSWSMFAPYPSRYDGWIIVKAKQVGGKEIDLFNDGKDLSYTKPAHIGERYGYNRWIKFFEQAMSNVDMLNFYSDYLCKKWNNSHAQADEKVSQLEIIFMEEVTPPPGDPFEINQVHLHDYGCFY